MSTLKLMPAQISFEMARPFSVHNCGILAAGEQLMALPAGITWIVFTHATIRSTSGANREVQFSDAGANMVFCVHITAATDYVASAILPSNVFLCDTAVTMTGSADDANVCTTLSGVVVP